MHALITGASSGIGEGLALAFAQAGYDVTLVARRAAELDRVEALIGGKVRVHKHPYDLSDLDGIEALVAKATDVVGPVDVLINNAGVQIIDYAMAHSAADGERTLVLNVFAPLRLTRAVFPSMRDRRQGTIVDIASVASLTHAPYMAYYSASKAALSAASITLRAELKEHGIHVMTVYPGPVHTPMGDNGAVAYETDPTKGILPVPWGTVEELSQLILKGIRRKTKTIIYPSFYWTSKWFRAISQWTVEMVSPKPKAK